MRVHVSRARACLNGAAAALGAAIVGAAVMAMGAVSVAHAQSPHLERIARTQTVRVCIWPDYYGISYRNPRTQRLAGIDTDLALELGKYLDVTVLFVDSAFARLTDDLLADRCDVAMFAIGITPSRLEKLRFTRPHLQSDIYAITTQANRRIRSWDDIDRPGVQVVVARGTLHEPIMRERLKEATLVVLDTPHAREQEVESGRADVFMTDFPYSRKMLDTADWARLIKPNGTYAITPYAWAVAPGDERWLAKLDEFMALIKRDGRLLDAARRYGLDPIIVRD